MNFPITHFIFKRRSRGLRGFTLIELAMSLFVFTMIVMLFGATFPMATRASHMSNDYAQASLLAQHKIDQIREFGIKNLNPVGSNAWPQALVQAGVFDSNPVQDAQGGWTFSFTTVDNLVDNVKSGVTYTGLYPAGSIGTVTIDPLPTSGLSWNTSAVSPGQARLITVTLTWQGGNQSSGRLTVHSIIASP
jgi:type II secretory pathway pseudopilin PulG